MNDFNLPKNIKQIGYIDPNLKIYIEDYAFTFIQQFSKENQSQDKIAILVGQECFIDNKKVLFISSVINPKYTESKNSMQVLTQKSFDYTYQQIDTYFPNLKIVGWVYSRPGFEKNIHPNYIKYHKETFFNEDKVLFLFDPLEKIGTFFSFSPEIETFVELKGFIIYYERNEAMSEYMLNNQRFNNPELEEKKAKEALLKSRNVEKTSENKNIKTHENKNINKNHNQKETTISNIKLKPNLYKKSINMFGSLAGVIILLSFVMGVSLIQNEDRISQLEEQISKIDETYKYLLLQVTNDSVQSVFAENTSSYQDDSQNISSSTDDSQNTQNLDLSQQQNISVQNDSDIQIINQETSYDKLKEDSEITQESYQTYIIQDGDSLQKISKKFYGNIDKVSEIMLLNNIEDPDKIYSGMSINLP